MVDGQNGALRASTEPTNSPFAESELPFQHPVRARLGFRADKLRWWGDTLGGVVKPGVVMLNPQARMEFLQPMCSATAWSDFWVIKGKMCTCLKSCRLLDSALYRSLDTGLESTAKCGPQASIYRVNHRFDEQGPI